MNSYFVHSLESLYCIPMRYTQEGRYEATQSPLGTPELPAGAWKQQLLLLLHP